jgi:diguanylate cyclase (GGDEF)-like protein/PAS domain S-box-containing protein
MSADEEFWAPDGAWQHVVALSTDLAVVVAADTSLMWVSPSAAEIAGYLPEEVLGRVGMEFVHPDDLAAVQDYVAEVVATPGRHRPIEFRLVAKSGEAVWVEERMTNLLADPQVNGLVAYLRDITDRRRLLDALEVSERRYRAIVDTADEGIAIIDDSGTIVFANPRLAELVGRPAVVGTSVLDHVDADDVTLATSRIGRARKATERLQVRLRHASGRIIYGGVVLMPFEDDAEGNATSLVMIRDDTASHEYQRELQHAALHDTLTGLPNRTLLMEHLSRVRAVLRPGLQATLLLLDLDQFTAINQSLGADESDQLLVAVGSRLLQAAGPEDLVARVGGDEFAVVRLSATTETQAEAYARQLLAVLAQPLPVQGETLTLTASIGAALTDDRDADTQFRAASVALTDAKNAGRGEVRVHGSDPLPLRLDRWRLGAELRQALDVGELTLSYQPIVNLSTGSYVGAEALARWTSPLRGQVPPDQFIPIAEESGLIEQLGEWVLTTACADAIVWPDLPDGSRPSVSVNVSTVQLLRADFAARVQAALDSSGLPGTDLILEVTETGVLKDFERAAATLKQVRDLGVRLHIDDFGTGYASMTYVRRFPINGLKIDRSFVAGLGDSTDDAAIVTATLALARATNLTVTAEGVESQQQADLLTEAGCELAQGYLWSRALPQDEWLGLQDAAQPLARASRSRRVRPSPEALSRILELHAAGSSATTIASALNREGLARPDNAAQWHRTTVASVITTLGLGRPRPPTMTRRWPA